MQYSQVFHTLHSLSRHRIVEQQISNEKARLEYLRVNNARAYLASVVGRRPSISQGEGGPLPISLH